jgi:hypothetical protein
MKKKYFCLFKIDKKIPQCVEGKIELTLCNFSLPRHYLHAFLFKGIILCSCYSYSNKIPQEGLGVEKKAVMFCHLMGTFCVVTIEITTL